METRADDDSLFAASEAGKHPLLKENIDEDSLGESRDSFLSSYNKKASSIPFLISATINIALYVSLLISRGQVTHERSTYGLHFQYELSSKLH